MKKNSSSRARVWILSVAGAVLLVALFLIDRRPDSSMGNVQQSREAASLTNVSGAALTRTATSNAIVNAPATQGAVVSAMPVADGKDADSIRRWAHNELEVQRMLDENDRIYRRQLVVLNQTVAEVVERNRLTGEQIRQLTLQGLDGQEILFEVTNAEIEPSGLRGMLYGHVAGRPDSMVTLAYLQKRQAYTILSPTDNLFLDVEPHDPGDVIVKSINLEKYGAGLCGNP
jgi:hypothetical protein